MRIRALAFAVVLAVAVTVPGAGPATAAPARSPYAYSDQRGDARYGVGDILGVVVDNGPRISVTVRMVNAIPFREWGDRISGMAIFFNPEAFMDIRAGSARFTLNGATTICTVRREFGPRRERYVFSMARSCLRDPDTIRVRVETAVAGAPRRDGDEAPRVGFSRLVRRR